VHRTGSRNDGVVTHDAVQHMASDPDQSVDGKEDAPPTIATCNDVASSILLCTIGQASGTHGAHAGGVRLSQIPLCSGL